GAPQLVLRSEARIDEVVTHPELAVERPQRYALKAVARERAQRRLEDLAAIDGLLRTRTPAGPGRSLRCGGHGPHSSGRRGHTSKNLTDSRAVSAAPAARSASARAGATRRRQGPPGPGS